MRTVITSLLLMFSLAACAAPAQIPEPLREADQASAESLARQHGGEPEFFGTVTSHAPEGATMWGTSCTPDKCVMVDDTAVHLALIEPYDYSCSQLGVFFDGTDAMDVKEMMLPVGTQVRVVSADPAKDTDRIVTGFIHWTGAQPDPVRGSFNESLVETGYWVPDYIVAALTNGRDPAAVYELLFPQTLSAVEAEYAPHILAAANAARATGSGGQSACLQAVLKEIEAEAEREELREARRIEIDLWWEQWKADNPGWNSCRDGDGDGVCYER